MDVEPVRQEIELQAIKPGVFPANASLTTAHRQVILEKYDHSSGDTNALWSVFYVFCGYNRVGTKPF